MTLITPDGKLLDFSGKKEGGTPKMRSLDHSDIGRVTPEDKGGRASVNYAEQMGLMRIGITKEYDDVLVSLDINANYTDEQWNKLKSAVRIGKIKEAEFGYDIYDGNKLISSHYTESVGKESDVEDLHGKFNEIKETKSIGKILNSKRKLIEIKQHTISQFEGGWKSTYSEDEEEEDKKKRKIVFGPKDKVNKEEFQGHKGKWVTLEGGQKVFIREGEMLSDALERVRPSKYKVNFESGVKEEDKDLAKKRLKRLMYNIPEEDLNDLQEIRIVEEADFEWRGEIHRASATYNNTRRRITMESQFIYSTDANVKDILYHEVGHHVWNSKVMDGHRGDWDKLFGRGIRIGYKFPSDYSTTNSKEGFAECYMIYRRKKTERMNNIFTKWFKENIG